MGEVEDSDTKEFFIVRKNDYFPFHQDENFYLFPLPIIVFFRYTPNRDSSLTSEDPFSTKSIPPHTIYYLYIKIFPFVFFFFFYFTETPFMLP